MIDLILWCLLVVEEKAGSGSAPKSETSSGSARDSPRRTAAATAAGAGGFPPNPFDFSAMSGLLNVCSYSF